MLFRSVIASNSCGTSSASSLPVITTTGSPVSPGPVTGLTAICPARTTEYTIASVDGAVNYTWNIPPTWGIVSGQGTTTITVNVPLNAQGGNVTVTANNICGSSTASILAVSVANSATVYAGPDQTVCFGTASVQLAGQVGGAIQPNQHREWDWIAVSGGTFQNDRILNTTFNFPNGGNTVGPLTEIGRAHV